MDTKQKKRPEQARKRSPQPKTGRTAPESRPRQRSAEPRSAQAGRSAQQRRQPERTAQQAERPRRQSMPQQSIQRTAQETHNMVQQSAYAPHHLPVEEQVFKTEQKKQRVMNPEKVRVRYLLRWVSYSSIRGREQR